MLSNGLIAALYRSIIFIAIAVFIGAIAWASYKAMIGVLTRGDGMAITLTLKPDVEARLIMKAQTEGISIEELLENTVNLLLASSEEQVEISLSSEEKAQQFLQWAERHVTEALPLDDEVISRESIYRERLDAQV